MIKNSLIVLTLVLALSFIIAGCGGGDGALNVGSPSNNPVAPVVTSGEGTIAINVDWKKLDDIYSKDLTGQVIYSTVASIKVEAYDPNGVLKGGTTITRTAGSTSQTGTVSIAPGTYRIDVGGYTSADALVSHRRTTAVVTAGGTTNITANLGISILTGGAPNPSNTYVSPGDTLYWRNNDSVARRVKVGTTEWSGILPAYDPNNPAASDYGYTFNTGSTVAVPFYIYTSDQATQLYQGSVFVQLSTANSYTYSSTASFVQFVYNAWGVKADGAATLILQKDSSSNVYVLDTVAGRIEKYDSSGTYSNTYDVSIANNPSDFAIDGSGYFYLLENGNMGTQTARFVAKLDSAGTLVKRSTTLWMNKTAPTEAGTTACTATAVTVNSSGVAYVAGRCRTSGAGAAATGNGNIAILYYDFGASSPSWTVVSRTAITTTTVRALSLASGNFVMLDQTKNRVRGVRSDGSVFGTTASAVAGTAGSGTYATYDSSAGDLYLVQKGSGAANGELVFKNSLSMSGATATWGTWSTVVSTGVKAGFVTSPTSILAFSSVYYVADTPNQGRIQQFNNSGATAYKWRPFIGMTSPTGIAVDSSSNYYVADNRNDRVIKFNSAGSYLGACGFNVDSTARIGEMYMSAPYGVAVDSSGNIYAAARGIPAGNTDLQDKIFKFNSSFIKQTGGFPISTTSPTGIAIATDGTLYAVTNNGTALRKFNSSGTEQIVTNYWPKTGLTQTQGVAIDASGYIWYTKGTTIVKIDSSGAAITSISSPGSGSFTTQLYGIYVDASGYLYVNDATKCYKLTNTGGSISDSSSWGTPAIEATTLWGVTMKGTNLVLTHARAPKLVKVFTPN